MKQQVELKERLQRRRKLQWHGGFSMKLGQFNPCEYNIKRTCESLQDSKSTTLDTAQVDKIRAFNDRIE